MNEQERLRHCIEQWDKDAGDAAKTERARTYARNAAAALRLELETGEPHCECHRQPLRDCPNLRK